jgi:tetratricopeptide (TPR) repeat protein
MRLAGAVVLVLLASAGASVAQSAAAQLYNQANRLYADGEYSSARDLYLQAASSGVRDPRLFYNLGNAYYKMGELGEAIVWYERARRLAPRDPDIRHNLRFANTMKVDSDPEQGDGVWQAIDAMFSYPTLNELCAAASALLLLLFGLGAARLLGRTSATTAWTVTAVTVACLLSVDGLWLATRLYRHGAIAEAVLIAPEAQARSGPDEGQTTVFAVHEGTKVRVERRQGEWLLVRLPNGLAGWLPSEVLTEI